jgi:RNA polymerase sigma-70 factor (ECF subfamily)
MHRSGAHGEWSGQTSELLREARAGSEEALGRLLDGCRDYLLLVANRGLDPDLRPKASPSDLVQETFFEAQKDFAQFKGRTGKALVAWLRVILRHNLADFRARYRAGLARQVGLERLLDAGDSSEIREKLVADTPPPDEKAAAAEQEEALRRALARLPEDSRRAIQLRNLEGWSFAEVGEALGRSAAAARKLWFRAVERLHEELEERDEPR